jgi:serine/threonine-protein kinase
VSIADNAVGQPTTIGRYVVLAVVGRGAMGEVYAAYDPKLNRKVAIKVLRAQPGAEVVDPNLRLRMMREAQAIAKLSHPNVVIVHDVGAFGSQVFVAMEFVDGQTLSEWLASEPRAWPDVLKIFADAGRGLVAAHEKDLVHRDFKPDNVMIGADGHVRVMDFGLARSTAATVPGRAPAPPGGAAAAKRQRSSAVTLDERGDDDLAATREVSPVHWSSEAPANVASDVTALQITHAGTVLGTPAYMAPEQFLGDETDARTDQFSFCVALYEALYRVSPFAGKNFDERKAGVLGGEVSEPPPRNGVPLQLRKSLEDNLRFSGRRRLASGAAAKLKGVWEAPVRRQPVESEAKAEMQRAFLATGKPYAAAAFEGAGRILDEYAAKWSAMYVDICEATHVRGEQSPEVMDLRMTCLLDCLEDLRALTLLFRNADAGVVQNAVKAANALGGIERCADVTLLRVAVRPPEDPTTRAAVDGLRAKLAEVRALENVGRYGDALKALAPLEEQIHRLGYRPLSAETLLSRGRLQTDRRELQLAAQALEDAVWSAEVCRHDEVVAEAAGTLMYVVSEMGADLALAEVWGRHAEAVLERMGGHDAMWGLLLNNRAVVRLRQGRLAEGLEEARRSLAAKERAGGTDNPDNAISLNNMGLMLIERGELPEALQLIERGLAVSERGHGPDHPATGRLLSNHAEILNELDRFEEAHASAARALAICQETDSDDVTLSYPLAALGVALLGLGRAGDALSFLERAAAFHDTTVPEPVHWGEVHFALARALRAAGRDLPRARALAEEAREEYLRAPPGPVVARGLARIDAWLSEKF